MATALSCAVMAAAIFPRILCWCWLPIAFVECEANGMNGPDGSDEQTARLPPVAQKGVPSCPDEPHSLIWPILGLSAGCQRHDCLWLPAFIPTQNPNQFNTNTIHKIHVGGVIRSSLVFGTFGDCWPLPKGRFSCGNSMPIHG